MRKILSKKCVAPAKKLYYLYYFLAQVVDLLSRSSSEVDFAVAHQIITLSPESQGPFLPPTIFFFFFAVTLRNKAGSAVQHNLFFISLGYDLFMITFNFNVYRFIFIIFPLGLLFPFVKIH